jgi:16S rRNA (adenine1518-N6/adenine1519-N6)-dimethyltransferase
VEIGSGRGVLTAELVKKAQHVIAIELDSNLASSLPDRLGCPTNLHVICADAREYNFDEVLSSGLSYKLMANLPYYAARPIIRRFLEYDYRPSVMVVMVQEEVGRAMTATPGHMTMLSVAVQYYGLPRFVCSVPPSAFKPSPKVKSAVVKIELRSQPVLAVSQDDEFFNLVRAGFSSPRKQLHNSLGKGLRILPVEASRLVEEAGLEHSRRPGTLALEEWGDLYYAWKSM